jgi:hypothetical protein
MRTPLRTALCKGCRATILWRGHLGLAFSGLAVPTGPAAGEADDAGQAALSAYSAVRVYWRPRIKSSSASGA